jgi:hypothetical protein
MHVEDYYIFCYRTRIKNIYIYDLSHGGEDELVTIALIYGQSHMISQVMRFHVLHQSCHVHMAELDWLI